MSKYRDLFEDIRSKTRSNILKWQLISKNAYSDIIYNPNLVFRIFETIYSKDETNFTVLFIEKKYEDPEWEFAYDKYIAEILFLEEGELVLTLNDDIIDRSDLIGLVKNIETRTDKAKKLLG